MNHLQKSFRVSFVLLIVLLFCSGLFAQKNANSSGLTVEGFAKMKLKPDVSVISLMITQRDSLEKKAINKLNQQSNALIKLINQIGISKEQIRIGEYTVSAERNYNPNLSSEATMVHVARNTILIEISTNLKTIDTFYKKMADSDFSEVNINIEHKVSKKLEEISRKKLTNLAIEDAKSQANNIISSLNTKLGPVINIYKDKSNSDSERVYQRKSDAGNEVQFASEIAPSPFATLELNEIEIEEKITLVFQLI
jgi:uncharacterized protein YggE